MCAASPTSPGPTSAHAAANRLAIAWTAREEGRDSCRTILDFRGESEKGERRAGVRSGGKILGRDEDRRVSQSVSVKREEKEIRALQKKRKHRTRRVRPFQKQNRRSRSRSAIFLCSRAESADRDLQTNKKNQTPPSDIFWIFWIAIGHWTREADFGGSGVAKRRVGRVAARGANEKSRRLERRRAGGSRIVAYLT